MPYEEILESVKNRDFIDSTREIAPLKKADDAIYVDSSNMTIDEVVERIKKIVKFLEEKGCSVSYVDINNIDKAVILYQIIAMGEASSNLARFDGIRYGLKEDAKTLEELYKKTI